MCFIVDTSFLIKETLPECLTTHVKPLIGYMMTNQINIPSPEMLCIQSEISYFKATMERATLATE